MLKKFKQLLEDKSNTYFIAEIGINHNGDLQNAFKLIQAAKLAGCNAVKFQKRNPKECVPEKEWNILRDTPWGKMTYIDYKEKIEFNKNDYKKIINFCTQNYSCGRWRQTYFMSRISNN